MLCVFKRKVTPTKDQILGRRFNKENNSLVIRFGIGSRKKVNKLRTFLYFGLPKHMNIEANIVIYSLLEVWHAIISFGKLMFLVSEV